MASHELADRLGTREDLVPSPAPPGEGRAATLGKEVPAVLAKRRGDLTARDVEVMEAVVGIVDDETVGLTSGQAADDERRRYRLLSVGHDPLRAG